MSKAANNSRRKLVAALFTKAARKAIDQYMLRDVIVPAVIGKRISEASAQEIVRLIEHVAGLYTHPSPMPSPSRGESFKYASSRAGLIEELKDVARARWGDDFERPLNAFVNANLKGRMTHYRFLNVTAMKALKERLRELNLKDGK